MGKRTRHKHSRRSGKVPAAAHAPLAELVRYLARRAAERDYAAIQSAGKPKDRPHTNRGSAR
jgi:hypothetical protein